MIRVNCHREGGDFNWFKDNLEKAEGSPKAPQISAKWTFDGRWEPEEAIPPVLPFMFLLEPRNGAYEVPTKEISLKWTPSRNAIFWNIYFGKKDSLENSRVIKIANSTK